MKKRPIKNKKTATIKLSALMLSVSFMACTSDDTVIQDGENATQLHAAFSAFNPDATTIYLEGANVVIETTGLPNHETVYWGKNHPLYKEALEVEINASIMSCSDHSMSISVAATPNLHGSAVATQSNAIGISVSGAPIFNAEEDSLAETTSKLDWTGGHIESGMYHYHTEPKAITNDDDGLVGILRDGVFIYGRKCDATGTYPTDLDASGGHTSTTQYTLGEEEYHYHIINTIDPTTGSYTIFQGPYQGY